MYNCKYFKIPEYICKDCGLIDMSDNALYMFDRIRELHGAPMIVTSGCRCKEYNIKVKGVPNSAHTPQEDGLCYGMDISCCDSEERFSLVKAAMSVGCVRIGTYETYIHMDFSPFLPPMKLFL